MGEPCLIELLVTLGQKMLGVIHPSSVDRSCEIGTVPVFLEDAWVHACKTHTSMLAPDEVVC